MIENLVMFASMSYGSGFDSIFQNFQRIGVFDFLLPFLIIFCLVFLTLNSLKIFETNRTITALISLSVAFISLSFNFIPIFFKELFPRMGVGLGFFLGVIILIGLFMPRDSAAVRWGLFALSGIVAIIVFLNTAGSLGWNFYGAWSALSSEIVAYIVLVAIIVIVVATTSSKPTSTPKVALLGD